MTFGLFSCHLEHFSTSKMSGTCMEMCQWMRTCVTCVDERFEVLLFLFPNGRSNFQSHRCTRFELCITLILGKRFVVAVIFHLVPVPE